MANRRTRSSKIQKIDEDSDFDQEFDQEFGPSQESVPSEGEQQRKYAFFFVYPSPHRLYAWLLSLYQICYQAYCSP